MKTTAAKPTRRAVDADLLYRAGCLIGKLELLEQLGPILLRQLPVLHLHPDPEACVDGFAASWKRERERMTAEATRLIDRLSRKPRSKKPCG